jgi:hypothetical protein
MIQILAAHLSKISLFAHEGHGHTVTGDGNTLWHYVTEPQHAWVFAVLVVVAIAAVLIRKSSHGAVESDQSI